MIDVNKHSSLAVVNFTVTPDKIRLLAQEMSGRQRDLSNEQAGVFLEMYASDLVQELNNALRKFAIYHFKKD